MRGPAYIAALLFGVIAGLRTFTAPAVVAWAIHLGRLDLTGSWLAFLGNAWVRWILTAQALSELVFDQLPTMPSRTGRVPFAGRLVTGTLSGAAIGAATQHALGGAVVGLAGAVVGTLGGIRARSWLADALHNDHPAGIIEDAVAIGSAVLIGLTGR